MNPRAPGRINVKAVWVMGQGKNNQKSRLFFSYLANNIKIAVIFSNFSSHYNTSISNVWDNHDNCYNTDTSLSSLSDDIFEVVPLGDSEP